MVFLSLERQGKATTGKIFAANRFLGLKTKSKFIAFAVVPLTFLLITDVQAASAATPELRQNPKLPAALADAELSQLSGGASPTGAAVTSQTVSALNANNSVSASSVITGQVSLQPGTFNGFNGIGNFVFNTGNNNNVQGTLSVTILTPAMN